jgi:hypothetical protein
MRRQWRFKAAIWRIPMPPAQTTNKKSPPNDPYEPAGFAARHGIGIEDARRILTLHKGDRDSSNRAAHKIKGLN